MKKTGVLAVLLLGLGLWACKSETDEKGPYFGNGFKNGWVDQHSAVIWTRLTAMPEMNADGPEFIPISKKEAQQLAKTGDSTQIWSAQVPQGAILDSMQGACPGMLGEVKLTYRPKNGGATKTTDWARVDPEKDFTFQWQLTDLQSNTIYEIEILAKAIGAKQVFSKVKGQFKTAPDENETQESIAFSVVSCHDYNRKDLQGGHKIYQAMEADSIDFYIHTGDIEYYDKPNPYAMTESMMHYKWNRLFALPIQRDFYASHTTYFMKDDHDTLKDDAFPGNTYGTVDFERGLDIFDKVQFPSAEKTYKKLRWGKDLELWILEGRNYRSKNTDPDGAAKTILGAEQKEWLFRTLSASDARYKIVVSPSPILGPDRGKGKYDNLSNSSYAHEGDEVRAFLNQFDDVFIVTGDRHWQFVTQIPNTNLWEFGTGSGADIHAGGWDPEDVRPQHRFLRVKGGYLLVRVIETTAGPELRFELKDVDGKLKHQEVFLR
ncbi:alkaline phosphatase D family protein [Sediminicola luteus]|nr:alkaline phosphatase D family protein [Sediminicola luteus]